MPPSKKKPKKKRTWRRKLKKMLGGTRGTLNTAALSKKLKSAQALYDEGNFAEARSELDAVLSQDETHEQALYLVGMTHLQLEEYADAIERLSRLVQIKAGHADYGAWLQLAYAYQEAGKNAEAIAELERLVERNPKLKHWVILAEYLVTAGKVEKAKATLMSCRRRSGDATWTARRDALAQKLGP